jgi:hypothetical protein
MAKLSLIEKHKLQDVIATAMAEGKSLREIARICSKKAKIEISHVAVDRYLKSLSAQREETPVPVGGQPAVSKRAVIVEQVMERDLDVINLAYRSTSVLVDRFEMIVGAADMFERRTDALVAHVKENGIDPEYLEGWRTAFLDDLKRNVRDITILNREMRENSKFLVDLREKAFTFNLAKEFMDKLMDIFQRASPEAFDRAMSEISANPRLQRIIEQQIRGVAG